VATDWLDGRIARRFGETSALGGFLDHVTDAAFVSLGLAA
jgi:phosphatidylglycerophosphate synthase